MAAVPTGWCDRSGLSQGGCFSLPAPARAPDPGQQRPVKAAEQGAHFPKVIFTAL